MFEIIYADPPWQYKNSESLAKVSILDGKLPGQQHYPTMSKKELLGLEVGSIAAQDSLLFLWVVSPMLDDGIDLMKAWGFKFGTVAFVWDKVNPNPGYYTMSQVELCLVGKRGRIPSPRGARNIRQFVQEKKGKHSSKPAEVRDRISKMFPTQTKVELFSRGVTDGWESFGNHLTGNDISLDLQSML